MGVLLIQMTFTEFKIKVGDTFMSNQPPMVRAVNRWRYGQTLMNVLYDVWPDKHNRIMHTEYDCFYSDENAAKLLDKLEKEWDA